MNQDALFHESRRSLKAFNEALAPLETIDPAIIGLTSTGEIVYVNRSACNLLDHPKENLEGLPIGAFTPGMKAAEWSYFWLGLNRENSEQGRTVLHLSGKKELAVEFRNLFIHESGLKYCMMMQVSEGNDDSEFENGGTHSRRLAQVLNSMATPALVIDDQHAITFLNQAACQSIGTTVAEAAGTTVYHYLPKRHADIIWDLEQRALESGRSSTHSGNEFVQAKYANSMTMLPFLDPGTHQKRLLVILNKPPRTTQALPVVMPEFHEAMPGRPESDSLTEVHEILEREAPIGIYLKNTDNRILWANHAFTRMTGLEIKDFIGMRVEDLISDPDIVATFLEDDNYVYATGKPLFNRTILRFNNQSGYYRLDKLPFINRSRKLAGIIGLLVEVDEPAPPIDALKKELRSMSQKLQETETALRVLIERREQDAVLTREELKSKVRDLILAYLEHLKQTPLRPEQAEFVGLIEANLKNFYDPAHARLSSPTYKLSPTELKVAQLIRDGKANKEIARLMHLSKSTILTHRHHVRAKLGIKNKKVNLRNLLNS